MIYFTADTHFGHAGILKHQLERFTQFANVIEMDECIADEFNSVVQPEDELWHLGDFAWQASRYGHYRHKLRVRKLHVVMGNHDSSSLRQFVSSLNPIVYRKFNGIKFHLCHYPLFSWRSREHGSIHLYGHSHGSVETQLNLLFPTRKSMDVGIDYAFRCFGKWRPFSFDEIMQLTDL